MRIQIGLILAIAVFLSCKHNTDEKNSEILKTLEEKEFNQIDTQMDTLGKVIATIDFKIKAEGEDLKVFEDGVIPWISLEKPEFENLIEAENIVLYNTQATLIIDYPLNNPAVFELTTKGKGFTRKELIRKISDKYHAVYDSEEASSKTQVTPSKERKDLMNRNQTDGKYGIWGHDLSDLDLSTIEVYQNPKGKIYLILIVES